MKEIEQKILSLRTQFSHAKLVEADAPSDPVDLLNQWLHEATMAEIRDFNAMTLATADRTGMPSARIVLLREVQQAGLVFYTNYKSKKGRDLQENPQACVNFFWAELERQIRVAGTVTKLSEANSDLYFMSRPRESQLGAWASNQSEKIESRDILDRAYENFLKQYLETTVKRPPHWGGYVLTPLTMEFWQGRVNRMHDRLLYSKLPTGEWSMGRLSP